MALWEILLKIGCPHDFVNFIRSFHEGIRAVVENGEVFKCPQILMSLTARSKAAYWSHCCSLSSSPWCCLWHLRIVRPASPSAIVRMATYLTCDACWRKPRCSWLCCVIYCSLMTAPLLLTHCLTLSYCLIASITLQNGLGWLSAWKKTKAMCQSFPPQQTASATIMADAVALESVDHFCYLGSFLSNTVSADIDITSRLVK